ncbi:MAG TPA: ABC transporter permease [Candidatus Eisenbergiella merdavium]|uniref:Transport permease protein n=1 Tax=Candidatus Eisenbergiella merdavium TaxID=2838551 RepID=A0A9D2NJ09_9FIRM|nr:ABC transporter permease [Candidatus Eisenbergiella merdavium]
MKLLKEIWTYREMIYSLVRRDIRGRYKGSILGVLWMLVDPLCQLIIYTIVFSFILPSGIDKFYLFLFVALVPWIFFNQCMSGGSTIILANQDMIKKIYFPREIIPISYTISNLINMLLSFIAVFVVVIVSRIPVSLSCLAYLPLVILDEFFLSLGIVLITCGINVYFRDVQYILNVISLGWMYLTPILYPRTLIPEQYRHFFYFNPLTVIIESYRDILYYGQIPDLRKLFLSLLCSLGIMMIGFWCFGYLKKRFAEEL